MFVKSWVPWTQGILLKFVNHLNFVSVFTPFNSTNIINRRSLWVVQNSEIAIISGNIFGHTKGPFPLRSHSLFASEFAVRRSLANRIQPSWSILGDKQSKNFSTAWAWLAAEIKIASRSLFFMASEQQTANANEVEMGLRPWPPNDQTLLVKKLKFACPTRWLIVLPHHKTFLNKQILPSASRNVFEVFFQNIDKQVFRVKQCSATWPNNQTLFVKQTSNVWPTIFDRFPTV